MRAHRGGGRLVTRLFGAALVFVGALGLGITAANIYKTDAPSRSLLATISIASLLAIALGIRFLARRV